MKKLLSKISLLSLLSLSIVASQPDMISALPENSSISNQNEPNQNKSEISENKQSKGFIPLSVYELVAKGLLGITWGIASRCIQSNTTQESMSENNSALKAAVMQILPTFMAGLCFRYVVHKDAFAGKNNSSK